MNIVIALIIYALLGVLIGILTYYTFRTSRSFAPWVPSSTRAVTDALDYIAPRRGMTMVDLGCGDGRILFRAAQKYQLHAVGYEISPLPYALAMLRQLVTKNVAVQIKRQDFYTVDLSDFDIIYGYGLPETINDKLRPKLKKELKSGAFFITYNFPLHDRQPLKTFHYKWRNVFVYKF